MENVIVIGSGPAAHTAAIYASRAKLDPLMFEGMMAGGVAAGGQLTTTTEVENYPGFPDGISGPELMSRFREQSINLGVRIETLTVDKVDLSKSVFEVILGKKSISTKSIIIATGATAKKLNVTGAEKLWQRGISACAVCDGALPVFRDKVLIVVGGGDTACEEATYLTKFASKVLILVRRDVFRASKALQDRVFSNKNIEVFWNTELLEAVGDQMLTGAKVINNITKQEANHSVGGIFYAIGHLPNTSFLDNQIHLDESGYIKTTPGTTQTSVKGVFAAGDVQDKVYRQAVTAAGSGCMAALEVERYLSD